MVKIAQKICHFYILFVSSLVCNVIAYAVDSPLCGTMDGSLKTIGDHKVFFKDEDHAVRTIELNGRIVGCYSNLLDDRLRTWGRSFAASVRNCSDQFESFCTDHTGYPLDYIEYLLEKHVNMLSYVFGSDSNQFSTSEKSTESDLCASHNEVIYPTTGKTADGNELFIFNTRKQKQGVMISVCTNKGAACHEAGDNFAYSTQCEQRYIYRELLALSIEGVPVKEKFLMPAFCACKKIRNYDIKN